MPTSTPSSKPAPLRHVIRLCPDPPLFDDTAIADAVSKAIYGSDVVTAAGVDSATISGSTLTLARGGSEWVYAITESNSADFTKTSGDVTIASACSAAGTFGVEVSATHKICAKCPAGSYSAATNYGGCTPCAAGSYQSSVGMSSCTLCPSGTYAEAGTSNCLPCAAGTYAGTEGSGVCKSCPDGTYSNIPGSTACLYCAGGVPVCNGGLTEDDDFYLGGNKCSTIATPPLPSEGSSILEAGSIVGLMTGLPSPYNIETYNPYLFSKCTALSQLVLTVAIDCSVEILPITDTNCAEPGTTAYSYNGLAIQGFYDGMAKIRTLLPSGNSSSYLLTLTKTSGQPDNRVDMTYFAASTDASKDMSASQKVTGTFAVSGNPIVLTTPDGNCPAVSLKDGSNCEACPVGYICDGTSSTACDPDSYNPYVGGLTCLTCASCRGSGGSCIGMTSNGASDYCSVPYTVLSCTAGQDYDAAADACVACAAGTYRSAQMTECAECPAGKVPHELKQSCVTCPSVTPTPVPNSVAPVGGLDVCEACPLGTLPT